MGLYDFIYLQNVDVEKVIRDSISSVHHELNGLTYDRTCMIYSSYIYRYLKEHHIVCHLVDTKRDLNMAYQHQFVNVPIDDGLQYVIDLTYQQFGDYLEFDSLYKDGYQKMSLDMYKTYLSYIERKDCKVVRR